MATYAALASLAQTTDLNRNQGQYLFSIDAKEILTSIHEYVDFLLSFLEDFPEKANRWECKIRDVAYETEDIIDHFMWQKMQSSYIRMNPSSVELEDLLKDVTEKIGSIAGAIMEERPADSPAAISSPSKLTPAPISLSPTGNDVVIGLDDNLMAINDRLCGQSSNLQVIPIVGMGGIGKTTLARTVYSHPLIIEHFEIRAWLTVSQDYSPQRFRKILLGLVDSMRILLEEHMSGDGLDKIDDSKIALQVFQNLKGRRYLVVIDDIWGTQVWDDLRNIFPDDYNGSRIMLTTRLLDVAAYPDSDSHLHVMEFMNDSQSWNLLKQKVFKDSNCPPRLEKVGKEIARKCLGLPLVVVLVAGFLSTVKKTRASWEEIAQTVNPVVGRESDAILSLSYSHLPHHLRPCFLYIGGFPEDADIHASRLVKLWVVEGFLKNENGCSKSLEDKAEECLEDLVKRNLVIVNSRKSNGKIKSCSLHDMVRDLCIRKARDEKFLRVIHGRVLPQDMMNERRISSFRLSDIDNIWCPTIRTIMLCFQLQNFPSWPAFLGRFRLLRVLDFLGTSFLMLPSQVFELFHLRYLALKVSLEIPSAISNLVNLQTLIIGSIHGWKRMWRYNRLMSRSSLPLEIWRMPQLRHFFFSGYYMLPHPPDGSNLPLENLQTLLAVKNLIWNEKMVQMIPNVKRLGLVYEINQEYHLHHLKYLHQLEKLEVNGYPGFSWQGQNPSFPKTLKKLTIVGGGFRWGHMGIIGSLPNLQVLKLLDYACNGRTWKTADEEFPQLEFFLIDGSHLCQWITQSSPLPRLKCLMLRSCKCLMEIPQGIGEIPTLELIEVDDCSKSVVESVKQIKKDQEGYDNYALQVRFRSSEREVYDKRPSKVESHEREIVSGAWETVTEEGIVKYDEYFFQKKQIKDKKSDGILEKMRVKCSRVVKSFLSPCRRK